MTKVRQRVTDQAPRFVSYLRVSTDKQGERGLGIAAQQDAVAGYLRSVGSSAKHLKEYVEVESGKLSDNRPVLQEALNHCRLTNATLVIAKLDRLSRDAHFLTGLEKAGVEFTACDLPTANRLTLTIMAAVAEHEREMISARTKAALAEARKRVARTGQRGKPHVRRLGNPNGAAHLRGLGNGAAIASVKARANENATRLAPVIEAIVASGVTSARGIASALNERGFMSPRGSAWEAKTVTRLQARLRGSDPNR